jgi:hypothetical protein
MVRFGINWLAPMPLGSDRQPDTVRFKVQHADLGRRKRTAVLDEDAGLTRPRGPEMNSAGELQHGAGSQPPDWNSTGKGIFYR